MRLEIYRRRQPIGVANSCKYAIITLHFYRQNLGGTMQKHRLILASQSPRRKEILETMGLAFLIHPAQGEESAKGDSIEALVKNLALKKAQEVAIIYPHDFVLAADTVVCIAGKVLGKPKDKAEAYNMIQSLSGKKHEVLTGVCVYSPLTQEYLVECDSTAVYFDSLNEAEIQAYIQTDEPYDKAGGYALQGMAGTFVTRIEGCASNVVGLPMPLTKRLLLKSKAITNYGD